MHESEPQSEMNKLSSNNEHRYKLILLTFYYDEHTVTILYIHTIECIIKYYYIPLHAAP